MFCPNCASPNDPGSNFCKQCGAPIRSAAAPPGGEKPKKRGCCSCSGCLFMLSLTFFALLVCAAYAVYSGPEFVNKFLAPSPDCVKELASLSVTKDDADALEKNLADFEKYIQKGGTVEIHIKEIELNSFMARRLSMLKKPVEEVKVKDLKVRVTDEGVRVMGVVNIIKLESYFAFTVKATVDENKRVSWHFSSMKLGKFPMPAFVLNSILKLAENYIKRQPGTNNFSVGGTGFQINRIAYLNAKIIVECFNPVKK